MSQHQLFRKNLTFIFADPLQEELLDHIQTAVAIKWTHQTGEALPMVGKNLCSDPTHDTAPG